ncbi:hypothetical protein ACEPAG_6046 [Sanghuangporus baumii]
MILSRGVDSVHCYVAWNSFFSVDTHIWQLYNRYICEIRLLVSPSETDGSLVSCERAGAHIACDNLQCLHHVYYHRTHSWDLSKLANSGHMFPIRNCLLLYVQNYSTAFCALLNVSLVNFDVKTHLVEEIRIKPIPSQTRSSRALRNSRIKRLVIFLLLEWLWLGFGLLLRFKIRPGVTGFNPHYAESTAAFVWSKYGLSSIIGVLWQFISAVPIVDMIREMYSGEWWFSRDKMDRNIDRVSTLTSGFVDQLKHTLVGGSTLNFRISFVIALLLLLLRSVAPSAISPGPYHPSSQADITIGLLRPDLTQVSDIRANPFGNQG